MNLHLMGSVDFNIQNNKWQYEVVQPKRMMFFIFNVFKSYENIENHSVVKGPGFDPTKVHVGIRVVSFLVIEMYSRMYV